MNKEGYRNSNHGGKRKDAGRHVGSKKRDSRTATVKVRVHPREKQELQRRAAKRGMSVSEYLLTSSLSGTDNEVN